MITGAQAMQRRKALKKSLRAVAEKAGITAGTLSRFERNLNQLYTKNNRDLDASLAAFEREKAQKIA